MRVPKALCSRALQERGQEVALYRTADASFESGEKRIEDFHFAAVPIKEWERIIPSTEIPLAMSSP